MNKEALKLALELKNSASAYWTEKEISIIEKLIDALAQPEQEPVAWATREDFYLELDRRVERIRKEMEIKTVTMRCKDYDVALTIIDMHFGHVFVGQVSTTPPQRPWVGLTDDKRLELYRQFEDCLESDDWEFAQAIEAALRSKNI